MVQQKIVMKVQMNTERDRTKAMKIAAVAKGVKKVSVDAEKQQVEVIGDGIDSTKLTMSLRKKLGSANIVSVGQVKPGTEEKKASDDPITWTYSYNHHPHYPRHYRVVHDDYGNQSCSIM